MHELGGSVSERAFCAEVISDILTGVCSRPALARSTSTHHELYKGHCCGVLHRGTAGCVHPRCCISAAATGALADFYGGCTVLVDIFLRRRMGSAMVRS